MQTEVFLAAGKTYDVAIQPAQTTAGTYDAATYAVFDRALSLSTNNQRDGGMQVLHQRRGRRAPRVVGSRDAERRRQVLLLRRRVDAVDHGSRRKGLLAGAVGANGVVLGAHRSHR